MTENLLTPSVIKLFGRPMADLLFQFDPNTVFRGYNNLLERQLYAGGASGAVTVSGTVHPDSQIIDGITSTKNLLRGMSVTAVDPSKTPPPLLFDGAILQVGPHQIMLDSFCTVTTDTAVTVNATMAPNFARIYAFTFEGSYYPLPRPPIFLVHGNGSPIKSPQLTWSSFDNSGVMGREWDFSSPDTDPNVPTSDLRYWEYEKGDFSVRLDPDAGPFEQILLQMALRTGADRADRSGMQLSGMQLSGMQLSGMQLGVNPNNRNGR